MVLAMSPAALMLQELLALGNLSMLVLDNNLLERVPAVALKLPKLEVLMVGGPRTGGGELRVTCTSQI